jgi:hypothetical protein
VCDHRSSRPGNDARFADAQLLAELFGLQVDRGCRLGSAESKMRDPVQVQEPNPCDPFVSLVEQRFQLSAAAVGLCWAVEMEQDEESNDRVVGRSEGNQVGQLSCSAAELECLGEPPGACCDFRFTNQRHGERFCGAALFGRDADRPEPTRGDVELLQVLRGMGMDAGESPRPRWVGELGARVRLGRTGGAGGRCEADGIAGQHGQETVGRLGAQAQGVVVAR